MKTSLGILLLLGLGSALMAQSDAPLPVAGSGVMSEQWIPASRAAHETVWQSVVLETNALGRVVVRTNSYTELATGLNYYDEATQAWQPSREEWEVYADGIAAQAGRTKVILAHNLNLAGAVDVLTPDGVRLVSSPVGLGFYDPVDGKQVLLAEVRNCTAERGAAANEIVFRDCFEGIRGSIRYLYTRAGFHQHVVIEERLALPAGFSDKSRLELYTEFAADTPAPRLETRVLWGEPDPGLRALMVEPDFTDAEISFGAEMAMRAGKAFSLGTESEETPARSVRVGKQMQTIDGKPVLIEAVEFKQLEPLLARLAAVATPKTDKLAINTTRRINGPKEQARLSQERFGTERTGDEIQLASQPLSQPAVVIDYELLSSDTNFTFKGDTTYFVSSSVMLSGTTTLEGGSVVKFTNLWWPKITISGPISCQTGPYRPAIFTVKDDNSVGATIAGSTGNPTNQYGSGLAITSLGNTLTNLRFAHLYEAIYFNSGGDAGKLYLGNAQFVKCRYPLRAEQTMCFLNCGATIQLDNALITQCATAFRGEIGILRGRHVTVNQCNWLGDDFGNDSALYLTNSLLVAVSNWGNMTYTTNTTVRYATDPGGIFQTVGAGAFYLANNSTNRNAGTTNINADLLAALKTKTTYPPVLLSNVTITASTNLLPQAARDTDTPDLGYHYDPLDFAVSNLVVTNATLVLSNGVALGGFAGTGGSAILIKNHGRLISDGSPLNPNVIVRYNSSQEQANFNWGGSGKGHLIGTAVTTSSGEIDLRFTLLAAQGSLLSAGRLPDVTFRNCQFYGGHIAVSGDCGDFENPDVCTWSITNCLFERITFAESLDATAAVFRNNLLVGGLVGLDLFCWSSANFRDNFFDRTILWDTGGVDRDYNGYINGFGWQSWEWVPTTNDVIVTNMVYEAGPLGDYYLPTSSPLLNAGSVTNAALAGLYHYTTTTNQVKEMNSIVDIGFHYVAVTNGVPVDTDSDGIPDYADPDADGDGLPDEWEWQNFGNLDQTASGDYDADGSNNGLEYTSSTDPNTIDFVITVANQYSPTNNVPLLVSVLRGTASSMAVLVDSTNFPSASWSGYTSNKTANLGSNEGWHQVWVGLRGRLSTSEQTWKRKRVKLDLTPPLLVVTNPTSSSVTVPIVQVKGYSPEPLASFSCDLTNALGLDSNKLALVLNQRFNTNTWEFTTNYFQCFDLPLTNGLNTLTLRATDLAGNVTVTNVNFTLDYSSKTNPPVIKPDWPKNGTRISGDSFTARGWVNDPTASVKAEIIGSGTTNLVNGRVGREGDFWIENLPLASGTNILVLIATDVATNSVATNINIIKSDVALTLASVAFGQGASGTISDTNYTVWVNGVRATGHVNGAWETYPRLTLDNAVMQVRAIPNSDNGGYGSGSSTNETNPISSQAVDAERQLAWLGGLIYASALNMTDDWVVKEPNGPVNSMWHYDIDWEERAGGVASENWTPPWPNPDPPTNMWHAVWGPGRWPEADGLRDLTWYYWDWPQQTFPYGPLYSTNIIGFPNHIGPYFYFGELEYNAYGGLWTVRYQDEAQLTMVTGGDPGAADMELYGITGSGTAIGQPGPPYYGHYETYADIPLEEISIGSLGNLDTNGLLYAALPPRTQVNVTPRAPANYSSISLGAQKYTLISETDCSTPTNRARTTIGVGELVFCSIQPALSVNWSLEGGGWLSGTNGPGVYFTASKSPSTSIVTARIGSAELSKTFDVIAPNSIIVQSNWDVSLGIETSNGTQMGAETHYEFMIGPTNVSFAGIQLRENRPAAQITWPNGTNESLSAGTLLIGYTGCSNLVVDRVADLLRPTSLLFNGTNHVDFEYNYSYHYQYRNEDGVWTNWMQITTVTKFFGSNKKCQETFMGVPSTAGPRGPWQPFN